MVDVTYDSRIDPTFVMECAKVGSVSVFSSQVVIRGKREISMKRLVIPECFIIEWVGTDVGEGVIVNLKLKDKNP
jgi:hypothetical protein